jgi:hypothetical protein
MTPHAALIELFARVGAGNGAAVLVSAEELSQWPPAAVAAMKSQRLLARTRPAVSVVCPGCEQECVMPVQTLPAGRRGPASFIVCDKRSDINRVPVAAERLTQWRCDTDLVRGFIATTLGLRRSEQQPAGLSLLNIGIASGHKRRQMLGLKADGALALVAGNREEPLAELIRYGDGTYLLDDVVIRQLIDSVTTADSRYTPSNAKREVRKENTRATYKRWQAAYRELKKQRANMSDVWYSQQLARRDVAGRSAETIRKNMKK